MHGPFTEQRERVGQRLGAALAPLIAKVSHGRQARMFHPDGCVFSGQVKPLSIELGALGERLQGPALARFSGALWRRGFERLDVLGIAVRFRGSPTPGVEVMPDDQDLLFATIVSPFTMPLAPFTTNPHDFLANHYWAVSPFDLPSGERIKFRISAPTPQRADDSSRERRLSDATAAGRAQWTIEARQVFTRRWISIAQLELLALADVDQEALRFSAYHCGRGIAPRGLVHALRRATYSASQRASPHSAPTPLGPTTHSDAGP